MHSQRKEIKADHGPERPALGAFHQSLQPELCVGTPPPPHTHARHCTAGPRYSGTTPPSPPPSPPHGGGGGSRTQKFVYHKWPHRMSLS